MVRTAVILPTQRPFSGRGLLVVETSGRRTVLTAPRVNRVLPDRDYAARRDQVLAAWRDSQDQRWRDDSRPPAER